MLWAWEVVPLGCVWVGFVLLFALVLGVELELDVGAGGVGPVGGGLLLELLLEDVVRVLLFVIVMFPSPLSL